MGFKDKLRSKKKALEDEEGKENTAIHKENEPAHKTEETAPSRDDEYRDLTEKLRAAFHEKEKEDEELNKRKELDNEIRGFRKSFRHDVSNGVKHLQHGVVSEVKHGITAVKEVAKTKKKEKNEEQDY